MIQCIGKSVGQLGRVTEAFFRANQPRVSLSLDLLDLSTILRMRKRYREKLVILAFTPINNDNVCKRSFIDKLRRRLRISSVFLSLFELDLSYDRETFYHFNLAIFLVFSLSKIIPTLREIYVHIFFRIKKNLGTFYRGSR